MYICMWPRMWWMLYEIDKAKQAIALGFEKLWSMIVANSWTSATHARVKRRQCSNFSRCSTTVILFSQFRNGLTFENSWTSAAYECASRDDSVRISQTPQVHFFCTVNFVASWLLRIPTDFYRVLYMRSVGVRGVLKISQTRLYSHNV